MNVQIMAAEEAFKQANQTNVENKEKYETECKQLSSKIEELIKERDTIKQRLLLNEQELAALNEYKEQYQK